MGQSLGEIDKFDDVHLSDDDDNVDNEDGGKTRNNYVKFCLDISQLKIDIINKNILLPVSCFKRNLIIFFCS